MADGHARHQGPGSVEKDGSAGSGIERHELVEPSARGFDRALVHWTRKTGAAPFETLTSKSPGWSHQRARRAERTRKRATQKTCDHTTLLTCIRTTTGLALIVSPKGKRSFSVVARDPDNKQVWKQLGTADLMTLTKAWELAAEAVRGLRLAKPRSNPRRPRR